MNAKQYKQTSLFKRPLSSNKPKIKSNIPLFNPFSHKYFNYFQSPTRDEELFLIKKKFLNHSKNAKSTSTSTFLSFISSINNFYLSNKRHDNLFNKSSKNNHMILTSMDNSSLINSKDKIMPYSCINNSYIINKTRKIKNKKTPESSDNEKTKLVITSKTRKNSNEKNSAEKNLLQKLNDLQINPSKSKCNSYRKSSVGNSTKRIINPNKNKNYFNNVLSNHQNSNNTKAKGNNLYHNSNNNFNVNINFLEDYLKKAKDIKHKQKIKNISFNNLANISYKKIKSPHNKNVNTNNSNSNLIN